MEKTIKQEYRRKNPIFIFLSFCLKIKQYRDYKYLQYEFCASSLFCLLGCNEKKLTINNRTREIQPNEKSWLSNIFIGPVYVCVSCHLKIPEIQFQLSEYFFRFSFTVVGQFSLQMLTVWFDLQFFFFLFGIYPNFYFKSFFFFLSPKKRKKLSYEKKEVRKTKPNIYTTTVQCRKCWLTFFFFLKMITTTNQITNKQMQCNARPEKKV